MDLTVFMAMPDTRLLMPSDKACLPALAAERLLYHCPNPRPDGPSGNCQPSRYRRSKSISALPGDEQLSPRAGYACALTSTHTRCSALIRPTLAITRGAADYKLNQRFEDEAARLTRVQRPQILEVVQLEIPKLQDEVS